MERLVLAANLYRVKPVPIYLTDGDFNAESPLQYAGQASIFYLMPLVHLLTVQY